MIGCDAQHMFNDIGKKVAGSNLTLTISYQSRHVVNAAIPSKLTIFSVIKTGTKQFYMQNDNVFIK